MISKRVDLHFEFDLILKLELFSINFLNDSTSNN